MSCTALHHQRAKGLFQPEKKQQRTLVVSQYSYFSAFAFVRSCETTSVAAQEWFQMRFQPDASGFPEVEQVVLFFSGKNMSDSRCAYLTILPVLSSYRLIFPVHQVCIREQLCGLVTARYLTVDVTTTPAKLIKTCSGAISLPGHCQGALE